MSLPSNNSLSKAERLVRVLERLADPRVLVAALVLTGAGFYWHLFRLHDAKLDAMLQWTVQKSAFDFLDCIRASQDERMERLCESVRAGQPIDLSTVHRERRP